MDKKVNVPLIVKHIHDHIRSSVDRDANLDSETNEGHHEISTLDVDDKFNHNKLKSFVKSAGWEISPGKVYDQAITSEGPFPGTTQSYSISKGKDKKKETYYVTHAHADPEEEGTLYDKPYHEITISHKPQDKLNVFKGKLQNFRDWLHGPEGADHLKTLKSALSKELNKKLN